MNKLKINEIFFSIQGESSFAGLPFIFIRLTGCPLRCSYCDTRYAYEQGQEMTAGEILNTISRFPSLHVMVTGGEPLAQDSRELIQTLIDRGYTVAVETSGALSLSGFPGQAHYIVDIKTPSSGMQDKMHPDILKEISFKDELKFVIGSREDYMYAKSIILKNSLWEKTNILISCVFGKIEPQELVKWILSDGLKVRFQLQLHKFIWGPDQKGV